MTFTEASTQTWGADLPKFPSFLGFTQSGLRIWEYYQPSVAEFAEQLEHLKSLASDPNPKIPLRPEWNLLMAGKKDKKQFG